MQDHKTAGKEEENMGDHSLNSTIYLENISEIVLPCKMKNSIKNKYTL